MKEIGKGKMIQMFSALVILIIFLVGCTAPSSAERLQKRGEAIASDLTFELQKIQSIDDLKKAQPKLRKKFLRIAQLLREAKEVRERHPGEEPRPPSSACDELFAELSRLYELPGGWELILASQEDALALYSK